MSNVQNKCGTCGKFTKLKDLKVHYTPDTQFTHEEIWHECGDCYNTPLKIKVRNEIAAYDHKLSLDKNGAND